MRYRPRGDGVAVADGAVTPAATPAAIAPAPVRKVRRSIFGVIGSVMILPVLLVYPALARSRAMSTIMSSWPPMRPPPSDLEQNSASVEAVRLSCRFCMT